MVIGFVCDAMKEKNESNPELTKLKEHCRQVDLNNKQKQKTQLMMMRYQAAHFELILNISTDISK